MGEREPASRSGGAFALLLSLATAHHGSFAGAADALRRWVCSSFRELCCAAAGLTILRDRDDIVNPSIGDGAQLTRAAAPVCSREALTGTWTACCRDLAAPPNHHAAEQTGISQPQLPAARRRKPHERQALKAYAPSSPIKRSSCWMTGFGCTPTLWREQ
jgi:hypothetical protein